MSSTAVGKLYNVNVFKILIEAYLDSQMSFLLKKYPLEVVLKKLIKEHRIV